MRFKSRQPDAAGCTRRNLLGFGGAALLAAPQFPRATWSDDRLGIVCRLHGDEPSARRALAAARGAGFRRIQVQFAWDSVTETYLRALPGWLNAEGLQADAIGAYVNCCAPKILLTQCREEDLPRAVDLAGELRCRRLVAWTGGFGAGLMKPDPRNFTREGEDAVCRFLEKHAPRLQEAGLTLALENYITLVCPDAPALARLLGRLPRCIGAVLDPPNLTPVSRFAERDNVLREMVKQLYDRIAVVHMKDFQLAADGQSYHLPGPLGGVMNYALFADEILTLPGEPAVVAEHLAAEDFAAARRKLLPVFAAAAGRRG